jgi:hypothetical protein
MSNAKLVISDVLELGPIDFEGLSIDTSVEMEILRVVTREGYHYAIESSTFNVNPFYVVTAFGHPVKLEYADNAFFGRLQKAIEAHAIELAKKTASDAWTEVDSSRDKDRMDADER